MEESVLWVRQSWLHDLSSLVQTRVALNQVELDSERDACLIRQLSSSSTPMEFLIARGLIAQLLLPAQARETIRSLIPTKSFQAKRSSHSNLESRILAYLDGHFRELVSIRDLARRLGTTSSILQRSFKQKSSMTIRKYIVRKRVDYACKLICHTDEKIDAVALDAGFKNRSAFYRAFHQLRDGRPALLRVRN